MVCEYFSALSKEAVSKRMKAYKKHFFALGDQGTISKIHVIPMHGDNKGSLVEIKFDDIYSVMAYNNNVAVLRVARKVCEQHNGAKISYRDGLVFVTASAVYMKFLFGGNARKGRSPQQCL